MNRSVQSRIVGYGLRNNARFDKIRCGSFTISTRRTISVRICEPNIVQFRPVFVTDERITINETCTFRMFTILTP